MKYYITFSCGHEGEVNLYGKAAERDHRIAWYEKEGICPDCYRKMKEEERKQADEELAAYADKIETEWNLPELEGTEKQVAWARKIRAGAIKNFEANEGWLLKEFIALRLGKPEETIFTGVRLSTEQPPKKQKPQHWRMRKRANMTLRLLTVCSQRRQRHGSSTTADRL